MQNGTDAMKDRPQPLREEHPSLTKDRNVEAGVRDSFPASDAPATTASQGVRAAPVTPADDRPLAAPADAARLTQAFPDAESAKLALETLVREAPLDRRCAEITSDSKGATLSLTLPREEGARVEALLSKLSQAPDRG